jgi:hypothetical protein
MANMLLRNFRNPSDYEKAKMTQDQLLAVAISNDANTARARKAYKLGQVPVPTEMESADNDELMMDKSKVYNEALSNVKSLGFKGTQASSIVAQMDDDDTMFKMNQTFPAIYKDITSRFDKRLLTPEFFLNYLTQYLNNLDASKGLTANMLGPAYNQFVDTGADLRRLMPSQDDIRALIDDVAGRAFTEGQRRYLIPIIERLNDLENSLPNDEEYDVFESMSQNNSAEAYRIAQQIQNETRSLPTREDFVELMSEIQSGKLPNEEIVRKLNEFVAGVSAKDTDALNNILTILTPQEQPQMYSKEVSSPIGRLGSLGRTIFRLTEDGPMEITSAYVKDMKKSPSVKRLSGGIDFVNLGVRGIYSYFADAEDLLTMKQPASSATQSSMINAPSSQGGISFSIEERADQSKGNVAADLEEEENVNAGATGNKEGLGVRKTKMKVIKIGKGIAVEQQPKYRELGKYAIHYGQLVNNDILNVKYKSLGGIPQFKPVAISDVFKDFLIDLLDTGKVNNRTYEQVPMEERKLFERIATGAGIIHNLKIKKTITNQDAEDNKRFELLKGEYLAGNNSNAVLKELRRFVIKFMNEGKITKNSGMTLLMELAV